MLQEEERPVAFVTKARESEELTLWVARLDGSRTRLATRAIDRSSYPGSLTPYEGNYDRRGGFDYGIPTWTNFSASPDGKWVLWKQDDQSWQAFEATGGRQASLPASHWRRVSWDRKGARFLGLDVEACVLQSVDLDDAHVTTLASLGDVCWDQAAVSAFSFWRSPDEARVAYAVTQAGYFDLTLPTTIVNNSIYDLHTVAADGTDDHVVATDVLLGAASPWSSGSDRLTYATVSASAPDPADRKVSFRTVSDAAGGNAIWAAILDLPLDAYAANPQSGGWRVEAVWSPASDRLALDTPGGLFVSDAAGAATNRVAEASAYPQFESWSPDGSHVAFSTSDGATHVARSDGSERKEIAPTEPGEVISALEWSPDGAAALYRFGGSTSEAIRWIDLSAHDERLVAQGVMGSTWSDDGTNVLYGTAPSYDAPFEYHLARQDGSHELLFAVRDWSIEVMKPSRGWLAYVNEGTLRYFNQSTKRAVTAWKDTPDEWIVDWASWDRPLRMF